MPEIQSMECESILTVAIICKNEERNITKCLDSVFIATKGIGPTEIILVDSYSTDGTIEIAKNYPIKIIRLKKKWPHSPAAGRYTAFRHATGRFTLSIDADMELMPGFLPEAIQFMERSEKIAGVSGIIEHVSLYGENGSLLNIDRGELQPVEAKRWNPGKECLLKSIPGAGLFRTSTVKEVGNFQPFLRAEEEYELCQRLRKGGLQLYYLPTKIARHFGYHDDEFSELARRLSNGFITGIGEMFKWSMSHGFFWENVKRFKQHMAIGVYILIFPVVAILSLKYLVVLWLWLVGLVFLVFAFTFKKKKFRVGLAAFVNKAIIGLNIYRCLLLHIKSPDLYPTDAIVIDLSQK